MLCACFQIWLLGLACLCDNEATGGGLTTLTRKSKLSVSLKRIRCLLHVGNISYSRPPKKKTDLKKFRKAPCVKLCEFITNGSVNENESEEFYQFQILKERNNVVLTGHQILSEIFQNKGP